MIDKNKQAVCSHSSSKTPETKQAPPTDDKKAGTPYYFQCGNLIVRTQFKEDGSSLASCLINYFKGLKSY